MKLSETICAICRGNAKTTLRLFAGITLFVLMTATAAYSQAIYSDVWIDESTSNENGEGAFVTGRGVSEINYVDEDGVEVETTLTSPNGRTVMSGAFGEISAQADARLTWDWDDFVGNFTIRVERFPMCSDGSGWTNEEGVLITHGYNRNTGTIWWRPTGYQRCPRNSFATLRSIPIGVTFIAMQIVMPPNLNAAGYLYEKVQPCDVYCNLPQTNRTPGPPSACIQLQIPFGPLGCSKLVRVVKNVQACICYDVGWN